MSLRKKLMLWILPPVVVLTFGIIFITSYAWYVHTKKIGTIDAETKDVAFTYTINGGSSENLTTYTVTNLSFFDIDSTSEVGYLDDMIVTMKITLTNTTKYTMAYKLTFESTHQIVSALAKTYSSNATYYTDETCATVATGVTEANVTSYYLKTSDAYCEGTLSSSSSFSTGSASKIEDLTLVHEYGSIDSSSTYTIAENGTTDVYLYLYGVQLVDTATNSDFINNNYKFVLSFEAQNLGDADVTEVTTTQVTSTEE